MIPIPDLSSPKSKANPFPTYARLRAEAPALRIQAWDKKPAWLITRYADVDAALKDPRLAKNPYLTLTEEERARALPWMPKFLLPLTTSMLDQDPPHHTRLRNLVHQAFTPRHVERLRGRIESLCAEQVDRARRRGGMDVLEDYALPMPLWIISDLLGVPEKDRLRFRAWSQRVVSGTTPLSMMAAIPTLWTMMRYVRGLVRDRREALGDDLLSALVAAEDQGNRLNEDELVSMVFLLLTAGHETTVNLISSGTLALLDNPESFERLRAEPNLIKPAVEELLRFTCPVDTSTERYTREEIDVSGVRIPRGERVLAVIASANHDEQVFPEPEVLKLDREPNRHLAFGLGPHYCVGAPLARMEAQIAISTLVRELPDLRLAVPRESLKWKRSSILRSLSRLPVRVGAKEKARARPALTGASAPSA